MYTNANFWRDMAILAGSWIMVGWAVWYSSEHKNGGASGSW